MNLPAPPANRSAAATRRIAHAGLPAAVLLLLPAFSGCKSAYVDAEVRNQTRAAIPVLEVDYPSASFGRSAVAAGASFHYRFKILGSGATRVLWTDAHQREHSVAGPPLHEGQTGTLVLTLEPDTASWDLHVTP